MRIRHICIAYMRVLSKYLRYNICISYTDGRKWAWKRAGEGLNDRLVVGTLKFEGSLMMWGCMTWEGVGFASEIDGRMDGDIYLQILKDELQ